MMAPDGDLYDIPAENVEAAQQSGFKVMSDEDMKRLHNKLFFAQKFFEQKHPPIRRLRLPRGRGRW